MKTFMSWHLTIRGVWGGDGRKVKRARQVGLVTGSPEWPFWLAMAGDGRARERGAISAWCRGEGGPGGRREVT